MLTFGSRTGQFATINGLALGNPFDFAQSTRGKQFSAAYSATNLMLNVTAAAPIPAMPDSDGRGGGVRDKRRQVNGRAASPRRAGTPRPFGCAQGAHGTDPLDPASVLRITQLAKSATGMQMQFPTKPGNPSASLRAPEPIASNPPTI